MTLGTDAERVLRFWFDELSEAQHWQKSDDLDRRIAGEFGALRRSVLDSGAAGWRDDPQHVLAAILLLDQFSRNIHRGTARAFEGDALALDLARLSLDRGWTQAAPDRHRFFLLMPLQHSEDLVDQERSVAEFQSLGDPTGIKFSRAHRDQIARFGRFPGRNAALGRVSSAAEQAVIDRGETF